MKTINTQTIKEKQDRRIKLMNEALSETGITPFFAADQALVNELCEIMKVLHQHISCNYSFNRSDGFTDPEIEDWIRESI